MGADSGAGGVGGGQGNYGGMSPYDGFGQDPSSPSPQDKVSGMEGVTSAPASSALGPEGQAKADAMGLGGGFGEAAPAPQINITIGAPGQGRPMRPQSTGGGQEAAPGGSPPAPRQPAAPAAEAAKQSAPRGGRALSRPRPVATLLTLAPAETTRKTLLGI